MFTKAFPTTQTAATAADGPSRNGPRTASGDAPRGGSPTARSRRRTAALLAGPILTTAGLAATPWEAERTTLAYHESLASAPEQAQIAALLLAFGYSLMGLAAVVVLRNAAPRLRRHMVVAAGLSWLGATLMPGLLVTDWYDLALAQHLPADQAAQVSEATQAYALGAVLMVPAILGFIAGPIAVVSLAVRSRLVGAWAPILLVVGIPLPMVSIAPVAMVGAGLTLVAAYAGIALGLGRRAAGARSGKAHEPTDPALDAVLDANRGGRPGAGVAL